MTKYATVNCIICNEALTACCAKFGRNFIGVHDVTVVWAGDLWTSSEPVIEDEGSSFAIRDC
jgi:hypothetical protein